MKPIRNALILSCILPLCMLGQADRDAAPTVLDAGPHTRVVQSVTAQPDAQGKTVLVTNQWTELAVGMNWKNPVTQRWEESVPAFDVTKTGDFVARRGQHKVVVAANINSGGSVDVELPDGQRMRSNPMGLSYRDASGKNVLLAEVKDCAGQLIEPNVILFQDCFDTLKGAIRYTYDRDRWAQDVLLYEDPGDPSDYQLDPATTKLECYSEFFDAPQPREIPADDGPDLDFGSMKMGRGVAYVLGDSLDPAVVDKLWTTIDGRRFLVEGLSFNTVKPLLERATLGRRPRELDSASRHVSDRAALIAGLRVRSGRKEALLAALQPSRPLSQPAVVLDYQTLNTGTLDNYKFEAYETYFVRGVITLTGTTILEGGAVIKFDNAGSPELCISGSGILTCRTSPYRPALFTAKHDTTAGASVTLGGTPAGTYAVKALNFTGTTPCTLSNVVFRYAQTAVALNGVTGHVIKHAQMLNCKMGVSVETGGSFRLLNALVLNEGAWLTPPTSPKVFSGAGATGRAEHLTVDGAEYVNDDLAPLSALTVVNSIMVNVTTVGGNTTFDPPQQPTGIAFQTVAGGAHYLPVGSTLRDASGTATLDAGLAADLKKLTTYAPETVTGTFTPVGPVNPRPIQDMDKPDLGYHYAPVDYVFDTVTLGGPLTLTNGVVVAPQGTAGLTIPNAAYHVNCEGTPLNLNRVVGLRIVQEKTSTASSFLQNNPSYPNLPGLNLRFRFTEMRLAGGVLHAGNSSGGYGSLTIQDCRLCWASVPVGPMVSSTTFNFINNLVENGSVAVYRGGYETLAVSIYNNLFRGGSVGVQYFSVAAGCPTWQVRDNLFDQCPQTLNGSGTGWDAYIQRSNNGFTTGTTVTLNGTGNKIPPLAADYQAGPLGYYYYPVSGAGLFTLINAGYRAVSASGLYHHTVKTAVNTKEGLDTPATVDIGFHYIGVDPSNLPKDTDGDGRADYAEDVNGDGSYESGGSSGETNWQISENGTTSVPGLQVFTYLESVVFGKEAA